ncbi:MAG: ankyrin repeat domain-containing protein [Limisphaerales bacterium]
MKTKAELPRPTRLRAALVEGPLAAFLWPGAITLFMLVCGSIAFGGEIHDAAMRGDVAKVKALLKDHPELVISEDAEGETPLHWAAVFGQEDIVDLLLANNAEATAKTNKAGETALHVAATKGYKGVAQRLLNHKADVNAKDGGGNTPLHWATLWDHRDMVELLVIHKAEINAKTNKGRTAMNATAFVRYNARNKPQIEDDNLTPLHVAAAGNNKAVAELLLANKAEVNARDGNGWTPLHTAVSCGNKEVAELLRQHNGQE